MMTRRLQPDNRLTTRPSAFAAVNGTVLCALDDDFVLFSEPQQRIYQFDATSRLVWLGISGGEPASAVAQDIASLTGCRLDEAAAHVSFCLAEWEGLGLLRRGVARPVRSEARTDDCRRSVSATGEIYRVAGMMIAISFPDLSTKRAWNAIAGHLRQDRAGAVETEIAVRAVEDGYRIGNQPGERADFMDSAALAVGLKEAVLHAVLARRPDWIALHAAVLSSASGAVVLAGSSGRGKTTLAALLSASGMPAVADDVALVAAQPAGIHGLAFAFAAKPGSWELLRARFSNLDGLPDFRRPDGRTVKYIEPMQLSEQAGAISAIVFPRYSTMTPLRIIPIRKLDALVALLEEALSANRWLTADGFVALTALIDDAMVVGLEYDDANAAAEWIRMNPTKAVRP